MLLRSYLQALPCSNPMNEATSGTFLLLNQKIGITGATIQEITAALTGFIADYRTPKAQEHTNLSPHTGI